MEKMILKQILRASNEEINFLTGKLDVLFELCDKYSPSYKKGDHEEILRDVVNTAIMNLEKRERLNIDSILYIIYKDIGDLVFDYLLELDSWLEEQGIDYDSAKNYLVLPIADGVNTKFDSPLSQFDLGTIICYHSYRELIQKPMKKELLEAKATGQID